MNESKEAVSIVPLTNFDSDVDLIRLDGSLCLRRTDVGELEKLIKLAPGYRFTLENVLLDVEYVIEKKLQSREFRLWDEHSPYVRDIVLALRLLKEGIIDTPTAFLLDPARGSYSVSNTSPEICFGDLCFLKHKEIDNFKKLWKKLQNVKAQKPHLKFPLDQFTKAFEENTPEDIIVDFMVAFESLVFHKVDKPPRPIGSAIGIAIGMLLGKNQKERAEIEKDLKEAYELRNVIVHGNLRKKFLKYNDERGTQLPFKTEDYLRRTLRKFLEE